MTAHTTTSLTAFLLARLDEDEAVARTAMSDHYCIEGGGIRWGEVGYETAPDLTIDPARVLAEVKAHRAIVAEHQMMPARQSTFGTMHLQDGRELSTYYLDGCCSTCTAGGEYGGPADPETGALDYCPTLRILASIHSAHPDYDESWRP